MKNKTKFSIVQYFDPYGDAKSERKQYARINYESDLTLDNILQIIDAYNNGKYYNAVEVNSVDNRKKTFYNFDTSHYLTSRTK